MKACIDKCLTEIQAFRIGMKNVCCTAFFQVGSHVLKCRKQKFIKLLACHLIVFNGQSIGTFKGNIIRRVGQHKVSFLTVHQRSNIIGIGGITAHQSVSANSPYIATLHKGSLFQSIVQIKIVLFHIGFVIPGKEVCDFIIVKACKTDIKIHALQGLDFDFQHFLIPACVKRHTVVGKDVGFLLCLGKVVHKNTRHLIDAFFLGSHHTSVSGNDAIILINNDGIDKAELTERRTELHNLLRRMGAGIIYIRH